MSFLWGNTSNQTQNTKKFANIADDQINSNQQAVPVKYLAGRSCLAGDYISPAYNPKAVPIKTQAGKGQSSTTGYKYFADFALMFCTGGRRPVDAIYTIIVDSDIRWDGNIVRGSSASVVIQIEDLGTMRLYWGSETQGIDGTLLSPREKPIAGGNPLDKTTYPPNDPPPGTSHTESGFAAGDPDPFSGHYDRHPAYRGQCYAVFTKWKLGRDRTDVPNIQVELARGCPAPWVTTGPSPGFVSSDQKGVNPIAVLYDWLTDTRFGMALPDSFLNLNSFRDTYNALEAQGARISPLISQQDDFRQVIAQLMEYFDGWIRRNGRVIEVGLWVKGNVISSATLTDNDLLADPDLTPQGWGPTINEVTVVYKDREHHFNDYTQVYRDPNNFRITGSPRPETYSRPWITDATLAKSYAQTAGATAAMPFTSGELTVKREWLDNNNMLPGLVFTYNSAFYGLSFLMRLLEVEHEADKSAEAKLSVQWEQSQWPGLYHPPAFQGPGGFILGPRAIWKSRITEVPYLLADQKFDTQLICLAVRGNVEVQGYRIWISMDGGSTYDIVPNDASTSAFASFARLDTALSNIVQQATFYLYGIDQDEVVSQTDAEMHDDNLLCFIDQEVMSIGHITTLGHGQFRAVIVRGRFGTTPALHAANSQIFFLFRSRMKLIDNAGFIPGTAIKIKLQPFTADLDYDITSLTPIDYTIAGFAPLPGPMFTPGPGPFVGGVFVGVIGAGGATIRYTLDGTPVSANSAEWPHSAPLTYIGLHLDTSTTIRCRFYRSDGRSSAETVGAYTKVQQIPGQPAPTAQCGAPASSFSGNPNHTGGNLTLSVTTPGSTIHFRKNEGSTTTYASPISIACNTAGDTVEFWASLTGSDDSSHRFFDNSRETTYGGGYHYPPKNPV
jgi:hypothetical protein